MAQDEQDDETAALRARVAELEARCTQLASAEARFRSILDTMPGIVSYRGTQDGDIGLYGADVWRIAGTKAENGLAQLRRWYEHIHPEDLPAYLAAETKRRETGTAFDTAFRYTHPNTGEKMWLRERAYCTPGPNGVVYNDGYILDLTEEYRRQERLETALDELARAQRAQSQFLANISHELRTPLNAIIGFAEMIRNRPEDLYLREDMDREYAGSIEESARSLLTLVEDLIDLSRAEAGRLVLEDGTVDLTRPIGFCLREFTPEAEVRRLSLTATGDPKAHPIRGDERRIRQMLKNLISNALKFSRAGGMVTVNVEEGADGTVRLSVDDTGIGIEPEALGIITEPFVQAEEGLDRHHGGAGLGLPLCRRLIELHGGRLEIDSMMGEGTTVTLVFPPERRLPALSGGVAAGPAA